MCDMIPERPVRSPGFRRTCVNRPSVVTPETDPHRIPRFPVRDWDGDEFRRLRGFFRR